MASPSHTHASAESARTAGHKSCPRSWRLHEPNAMRRSPRWSSGVVVVAGSSPGVLTWSPLAAPATIARNARSPKAVRIVALRHGGTVMTILFSTRTEYTRDGRRNIPRRSGNIGRYPAKSRARGVAGCVHDDAGGRNAPAPVPGTAPGPARWSAEVIPRSCGVSRKPICLPAPCISRLAPNARKNGMFSRPRICLTRISRIDRMGQR